MADDVKVLRDLPLFSEMSDKDLRKLLESMDYTGVATLLNSGNAVFEAKAGKDIQHAKRIREAVATQLGVDALVIVKSAKDIAGAIEGNALAKHADVARIHHGAVSHRKEHARPARRSSPARIRTAT